MADQAPTPTSLELKTAILAAGKSAGLPQKPVKAFGINCFVRTMSGTERDDWEAAILDSAGKVNKRQFRARLIQRTLCSAAGILVFDPENVPALSELDSAELDRLYDIAAKLNRIGKTEEDELIKNS